jgi:hypothetical protein
VDGERDHHQLVWFVGGSECLEGGVKERTFVVERLGA